MKITLILGICFLVVGCHPAQPDKDLDGIVRKNGGYTAFRAEAETAFKAIALNESQTLAPSNYPPTITAMSPQIVMVHEVDPPVLEIQTSGGFNHRGLLVVLGTNTNHRPEIGHGWVRKELAPGVFEFKE